MSRRPSLTPQLWIGQQIWLFTLLFHCMGRVVWWDIFRNSCWQLMSPHLGQCIYPSGTPREELLWAFRFYFLRSTGRVFFTLAMLSKSIANVWRGWKWCDRPAGRYDKDCAAGERQNMRMHMEANHLTNTISFSCDTCGKTSRSRHGLKLHKAREHSSSFQDQRWFAAAQKRKKLDFGHWKWPKIVNL